MQIDVDSESGFCFGVVNAIRKAEDVLSSDNQLFCLGDIVHNSAEVNRLQKRGLQTITHAELLKIKDTQVLFRAHGEPPTTYEKAKKNRLSIIDASCPVVLRLQERIRRGYEEVKKIGGQIVIFGKQGHAEVNGLVGQTDGTAIVINSAIDIEKIDYSRPVFIYAQTTKSTDEYELVVSLIRDKMQAISTEKPVVLEVHNTICKQVSSKDKKLRSFASRRDVIIFVSGRKSSNGKVLFEICKKANSASYFISDETELKADWFLGVNTVGVCGATSTPRWLMEQVAKEIRSK